jgi:hypothetical protein
MFNYLEEYYKIKENEFKEYERHKILLETPKNDRFRTLPSTEYQSIPSNRHYELENELP